MGRGSWVTDPGFVCVMGFGCYNGGAVTCYSGAVTCGGGGSGGLWLLQWWLWQVEQWTGWWTGLAGCYSFVWSCFIIVLMSSLYYLNEMVKNIEGLILSVL